MNTIAHPIRERAIGLETSGMTKVFGSLTALDDVRL